MDEHQSLSQEEPVCAAWQRTIQAVIGVFLLAGAILAVHYHEPARTDERRTDDLRTDDLKNQVQQLTLQVDLDRKSTRLNSSHRTISYAVFCLKKKKKKN